MDLTRFERAYFDLTDLFTEEGFNRTPNEYEKDVFVKVVDYYFEVKIITSRLEQGIIEMDSATKSFFAHLKEKDKVNESQEEKLVMAIAKIRLDLLDFYIHTRIFLDTLTECTRLSFKRAGNRNWHLMSKSVRCLLNEDKLQNYGSDIDAKFFESLRGKISWIRSLKDYRDGLLHRFFHFVFTQTLEGDLGYDIMDGVKTSWGTETVKSILQYIQSIIDNLSDLLEYLSKNLPKNQK